MQGERSAETLSYSLNEVIEARNELEVPCSFRSSGFWIIFDSNFLSDYDYEYRFAEYGYDMIGFDRANQRFNDSDLSGSTLPLFFFSL